MEGYFNFQEVVFAYFRENRKAEGFVGANTGTSGLILQSFFAKSSGGVMRKPIVWDAIIAWRDDILKKDILRKSKTDHLSHMTKMIEINVFDLEQPLSEFVKTNLEESLKTINKHLDWSQATKQYRCMLLRSFYRFAENKKIKQTDIAIPESQKDAQRNIISEILSSNENKAKLLNTSTFVRFMRKLSDFNARDSLICWMMWEFQCTLQQILNISINDIDFPRNIINFKDGSFLGQMQTDIKKCILAQKKEKSGADLLFTTEKGKGIHPGQIVRSMKIASQRAKLPFIFSPKLLYADAKAYGRKAFLSMSEDERTRLCLKMELSGKDKKKLADPGENAL